MIRVRVPPVGGTVGHGGPTLHSVVGSPIIDQTASRRLPIEPIEVDAGEAVVTQGESGDRYYLIQSGEARVLVDGAEVRALGTGEGFGEIALLRRVPRTATVQATTPMRLQALDRKTFISVVTGSPPTKVEVERVADHRLSGGG